MVWVRNFYAASEESRHRRNFITIGVAIEVRPECLLLGQLLGYPQI
jgi:hypothetical protein